LPLPFNNVSFGHPNDFANYNFQMCDKILKANLHGTHFSIFMKTAVAPFQNHIFQRKVKKQYQRHAWFKLTTHENTVKHLFHQMGF